MIAFDFALRGAAIGLLAYLAVRLLIDAGRSDIGRLGAVLAVGTAAHLICGAPVLSGQPAPWRFPLMLVAAGNPVVVWLFARSVFDDDFAVSARWAILWVIFVGLALIGSFAPDGGVTQAVFALHAAGRLILAAAVLWQIAASWRDDLVEARRRLRVAVVGAMLVYMAIEAASDLTGLSAAVPALSVMGAATIAAIAAGAAWAFTRLNVGTLLPQPAADPAELTGRPIAVPNDPLISSLDRLMTVERAYRQEGLTIGNLAGQLGVPEYRLRQMINRRLGHRNFTAFVNSYRLADATAALADPTQDPVPILTIALDAGFQSVGPFNRAFRTATGMTPSDFRRTRGGKVNHMTTKDNFKISQSI